ncbi:MAG: protein kinase, partial [Myxococcales bacterium]|nr:protein kinase [Myxococcales bacterium]
MELATGAVIADKVRLVRPLGRGGMGSVWLAEHLALDTEVAVKFISSKLAGDDPAVLERFRREASAAARIKSPHVVQTYDRAETEDGTPFIVMELLTGESLAARLRRLGPLGLEEATRIVEHVARGLGAAHALGIVHRDIKPDNVFVTPSDGEVFAKVLDFGVAKQHGGGGVAVTSTDAMVGTPAYMSPEQVLSAKLVDHRADLWALGVVAYQMLTGRLPFLGETVGAVAVAISRGRYRPASELRAGLPPTADAFFRRALHRRIDSRFGGARELAQAFAAALGGAGERAPLRPEAVSWPGADERHAPPDALRGRDEARDDASHDASDDSATDADASSEAPWSEDASGEAPASAADPTAPTRRTDRAPLSGPATEDAPYAALGEPGAPSGARSAPERTV